MIFEYFYFQYEDIKEIRIFSKDIRAIKRKRLMTVCFQISVKNNKRLSNGINVKNRY
jgi:hypothetical protein